MIYNYLPLERVYHGIDCTKDMHGLLGDLKSTRALIITNKSVSSGSFYRELTGKLPIPFTEFKEITQHSPMEEIEHATESLRNHKCDIIISIGGGSVIDAAKVVRYYYDLSIKHIAIPTTLSAAEFSHIAGYTIGGEKTGIRDRRITPTYVFLDPRAVLETPQQLWRSTGIRALDHAIETIYSNPNSEVARAFAVSALKKLFNNLRFDNLESRYECLIAAWFSYFEVYDSPMGLSHNIGKVIGAKFDVPHGVTSCITLPQVLMMYANENPGLICSVSRELGFTETTVKECAEGFARYVENFIDSLGLAKRLTDFGITETDLDYIVGKLKGDPDKLRKLLSGMF